MLSRLKEFSYYFAQIHRNIQKIEQAEMAKFDLKGSTAQYLVTLRLHSEGLTASRLCELCAKDKAAISRVIGELEEKGYVIRESSTDRAVNEGCRVYRARLFLTPTGIEVADKVLEATAKVFHAAGYSISEENSHIFYESMRIIANNLQSICKNGLPEE